MTVSTPRIISQGEIVKGASDPPPLRLPDPGCIFADRAARFVVLAGTGHGDAGYLEMVGRLAQAQQSALDAHQPPGVDLSRLELCHRHGLPPLGVDTLDASWRDALIHILRHMGGGTAPDSVRRVSDALKSSDGAALDVMADRLINLDYPALDPAAVPFVAAALQVHWVRRATMLGETAFSRLDVANICPVCGSPPVAAALRIGIPVPGARYLHCALCCTDWQYPRGQCTQCESREKIAYFHIEDGSEAVKAEACEECYGYLKIVNMEKDPLAEPMADDLATLALDVLMDESGYQRATPNFFFVPGQT
ncbi:MAG: formate dehydrogenase accessory protein FdhE [Burkholderiales bacterium]|nr:formate dehydrogenase accessory protein FdhE [Burkholderiales bacterium]